MKNTYALKTQVISWARLFSILLMVLLTAQSIQTNGQVVTQSEGHEGTIFPAPGWGISKGLLSALGSFSRQTYAGSTFPTVTAAPGGGTSCVMFNSFSSLLNDDAFLISKPFDFSQNGGVDPTFSFHMYRDNNFTINLDRIEVFINTVPSITGATLLTNTVGTNVINRPFNALPVATANTWNQYTYSLPAATYNQRRYYFIIKGTCLDGFNIYLDNFITNTYPSAMVPADVSFELVQQNLSSTAPTLTNQWVLGVRCVVNPAGPSGCGNLFNANLPVKLDSLLFNTNGTSSVANITNAKIFYTGGSPQFSTGYVSPFPVAPAGTTFPKTNFSTTKTGIATNIDFDNPAAGPCFYLEYDTTYFWLTYDIAAGAAGGNFIDADFRGAAIAGTGCPSSAGTSIGLTPTTFTLTGALQIDLPYVTPTYTVGTAWAGYTNNDYINRVDLTGFAGINIATTRNAVALQATVASCFPNCNFTAHPPDYELRSASIAGQTAVVQVAGTYSITVQVGTWTSNNAISAWIDWDKSGSFDPGEVLGYASLPSLGSATWNFTVPPVSGNVRMRVREVFAASNPISPTANYTYGECEDFTLTVVPNCPGTFRLWLGNTNDWNNPSNWCPTIPTINDSVVIDRSQIIGLGTRAYFNPTIKSGITANCRGIFIASTDTLIIDAPNPGSGATPPLKVKGSVTNNGQIRFSTGFTPEITYSNQSLVNFTMTPFIGKTYKAGQTQIIYSNTELAAQGIQNGDRITALKINIKNNDLSLPTRVYNNFTISYKNDGTVPTQHASTVPLPGPFTTALSTPLLNVSFGLITINLPTAIIVNPAFNLVIQICFTNSGPTGSAFNDYIDITETTGRNSILILGRLPASVAALPVPPNFVGTVAGDITANGFPIASPTINAIARLRPNVTFVIDRPYTRPTVVVQGNFINNNSFLAGRSLVLLDSASTQRIGGTQPSTFFDLEIAKTTPGTMTLNNARPVIMDQQVTIQDTLKLTAGQFIMNNRTLTMTNPNPEAFWRTQTSISSTVPGVGTGFLISESTSSQVDWIIGNWVSVRQRYIPFGNRVDTATAVINYIPVGFRHTSGNMGTFSASTYFAPNNLPLPPTVTHLNTFASTNQNQAATADRFWMIGKTGANPIADLSLRISNTAAPATERPATWTVPLPTFVKAQPWRVNGLSWLRISDPTTVATQAVITGAVGAAGVVTYTTSLPHNFRVGTVVTTAAIVPAAYNLVGAVISSTPTATTFTVVNGATGAYVSGGTVLPVSAAAGGTNYNVRQTTTNYAQAYAQVGAAGHDSLRISAYDWPIVPLLTVPYNTPSAPIGDFTPWAMASNNVPLPIELVDFKATAIDKQVRLDWETATEINNDFFTIERSRDLVNFEEVAQLKSQMHNSNVNLYYQTWDEKPLYGMSYYRLKQTDFNGEFTYSDYRAVWFGSKTPFDITNVFSEASTSNDVNVDFVYNSEEPLDVMITDLAGRVILKQSNMAATVGTNRIRLNKALTRGIYFVTLQNSEEVVSRKFIY